MPVNKRHPSNTPRVSILQCLHQIPIPSLAIFSEIKVKTLLEKEAVTVHSIHTHHTLLGLARQRSRLRISRNLSKHQIFSLPWSPDVSLALISYLYISICNLGDEKLTENWRCSQTIDCRLRLPGDRSRAGIWLTAGCVYMPGLIARCFCASWAMLPGTISKDCRCCCEKGEAATSMALFLSVMHYICLHAHVLCGRRRKTSAGCWNLPTGR